jgi:hypothetical protein
MKYKWTVISFASILAIIGIFICKFTLWNFYNISFSSVLPNGKVEIVITTNPMFDNCEILRKSLMVNNKISIIISKIRGDALKRVKGEWGKWNAVAYNNSNGDHMTTEFENLNQLHTTCYWVIYFYRGISIGYNDDDIV